MGFFKRNKAALSGTLIAILAIGGFIGLGYWYSSADVGYDYVGTGPKVESLNYNTGTGNMYRVDTPLNEGLITPTVNFENLQASIAEKFIDGEDHKLATIETYNQASSEVLEEYANEYNNNDRSRFDLLNDNEKTLVILASDTDKTYKYDETSLQYASDILTHHRPVTLIGDDEGEEINGVEWDPNTETGSIWSQYAYGVSDAIYVSNDENDRQHFRFRMRDGSMGDGAATWQTWYDDGQERIDRVSAADIAFGMSRQLPAMYGSSSRYMYTSIAKLVGSSEASAADPAYSIIDDGRYDYKGDIDSATIQDVIYYGVTPNGSWSYDTKDEETGTVTHHSGTFTRSDAITWDDEWEEFGSNESGITFWDPENEDLALNEGEEHYSYIDFTTTVNFSTFPTAMQSTAFWPINWEWFIKTIGLPGIDQINEFGTSADTILSNGGQQVTSFDNLYGYTTEKNENYVDANLVTNKKTSYRMVDEASTQVAMFENGDATYINGGDINSKVIMNSEIANSWLPDKFTKPANKYLLFNLGTDRLEHPTPASHAVYTSDPNFRRAFSYMFDANVYHQFNSTYTARAVSTFEPLGMYKLDNKDFVDYMTETTYTNLATSEIDTVDEQQLEYYTVKDREEALNGTKETFNDVIEEGDPNYNPDLADYYFQIFLDDMEELGVDLESKFPSKELQLNFLTSIGENDPFVKTIQQTMGNNHIFPGGWKITVYPNKVDSTEFFKTLYAADYDVSSIQWSADYLDAWSNIGIFNISENSRGGNSTGGWNMWDGSDFTFDNTVYGEDNTEKARGLFNDGFKQLFELNGDNANIKSIEYNGEDLLPYAEILWGYVFEDNKNISEDSWNINVAVADTNNETNTTYGLDYNKHSSDPVKNIMAYNLLFEMFLKDGAPGITGTTESGSISPSRGLLDGDPIVGYESRTFAFDVTKLNSFWSRNNVASKLRKEFIKNKK